MKGIIPVILISLFTSCSNILINQTEKKAIQEVLAFYGGTCNYSVGFSTTTDGTEKYFELGINKSELVESYSKVPAIPASNIAYLFYKNLQNEQNKYTHIKVKINLKDGQSHEYKYNVLELNEVINTLPVLNEACDKIKNKDFRSLLNSFEDSVKINLDENKLKSFLTSYDSAYGTIKETQFQGFYFPTEEISNQKIIQLFGVMLRTKENTPVTLLVNRRSEKLFLIKYGI